MRMAEWKVTKEFEVKLLQINVADLRVRLESENGETVKEFTLTPQAANDIKQIVEGEMP